MAITNNGINAYQSAAESIMALTEAFEKLTEVSGGHRKQEDHFNAKRFGSEKTVWDRKL